VQVRVAEILGRVWFALWSLFIAAILLFLLASILPPQAMTFPAKLSIAALCLSGVAFVFCNFNWMRARRRLGATSGFGWAFLAGSEPVEDLPSGVWRWGRRSVVSWMFFLLSFVAVVVTLTG
jgi:hypothetical protein